MSTRRFKDDWHAPGWLGPFVRAVNALFRWANYPTIKPPLQTWDNGVSFGLRLNPNYGFPVMPVKITGAKVGSYYPGSAYANGIEEAATNTEIDIYLPGFDVTYTDPQGFYPAVRVDDITDATNTIYQVVGMGTPPVLGGSTYYLRIVNGVLQWVGKGSC